jgi:predicted enzyme related to lactoylglutathione lyase
MDRAVGFYRDRLGIEPTERMGDGSARYDVNGMMLMLYPSEFAGSNEATAAGFAVADIETAVGTLRDRGVVFEEYDFGTVKTVDGIMTMPNGTRGGWFKDSEGNIIGVFGTPGGLITRAPERPAGRGRPTAGARWRSTPGRGAVRTRPGAGRERTRTRIGRHTPAR